MKKRKASSKPLDLREIPEPKPLSHQYIEDAQWVRDHIEELTEKYPDKWIAVYNGRVVAAGTGTEVYRIVEKKFPGEDVYIQLIEATRFFCGFYTLYVKKRK